MKWCDVERRSCRDSEFRYDPIRQVWMHCPPGEPPHEADVGPSEHLNELPCMAELEECDIEGEP
jgi:hypothetical protein